MWNLDRAFSTNGRRWKLRILASRQTKYEDGSSLTWRWSYTINSYDFNSNCYDFNSNYWLFEEKILHAPIKLFFRGVCNICGLRHSEQLWYGYRTLYRYEYNKIYLTTTAGIREAVIKYSTWECYRLARYTTYLYISLFKKLIN